jgi:hypothetical protein
LGQATAEETREVTREEAEEVDRRLDALGKSGQQHYPTWRSCSTGAGPTQSSSTSLPREQCRELHVNKASHNTVASLMVKINEVMGNLNKDAVAKACRGFRTKIEAVVEANGDFFET